MSANDPGFKAAVEEAQKGYDEGGVPIGACLVSKDGKILGRGHNMRVQKGSATLHVSQASSLLALVIATNTWLNRPRYLLLKTQVGCLPQHMKVLLCILLYLLATCAQEPVYSTK